MSLSDATPRREQQEEPPANPVTLVSLVDEMVDINPHAPHNPNLAAGIVWADILADIAADEEERQLRAAERLSDAA
ncbi:hypothetical protein SAMN05192558_10236 [Actinokineospora alba]|uniref:Uncharacterized protein n=1 Tax=Actinokineospora alba TaxID=504798 RepID=A0A1H0HAD7_9PSEU|nr:DUF6222 family protein [Actinokineospora alba]TDP64965.1 hypothetical protein C8E96_0443 [Actinokineospora alba]SDH50470.1 hypothetical protein SAMN05421871_101267 [Actinokineospora alba]SDO16122.1 hypothetical protein SAMN05192558_10236 [Actinokineospora alba]